MEEVVTANVNGPGALKWLLEQVPALKGRPTEIFKYFWHGKRFERLFSEQINYLKGVGYPSGIIGYLQEQRLEVIKTASRLYQDFWPGEIPFLPVIPRSRIKISQQMIFLGMEPVETQVIGEKENRSIGLIMKDVEPTPALPYFVFGVGAGGMTKGWSFDQAEIWAREYRRKFLSDAEGVALELSYQMYGKNLDPFVAAGSLWGDKEEHPFFFSEVTTSEIIKKPEKRVWGEGRKHQKRKGVPKFLWDRTDGKGNDQKSKPQPEVIARTLVDYRAEKKPELNFCYATCVARIGQ